MKFKVLIYSLAICLLVNCRGENNTDYYVYLQNKTSHTIIILPHKNGNVLSTDTITLKANSKILFSKENVQGDDIQPGYLTSSYFGDGSDSIIVVFDNTHKIIHYSAYPPTSLNIKHYLYNSSRNIHNYQSYLFTTEKKGEYSRENNYLYTFTEQDYLDAKP